MPEVAVNLSPSQLRDPSCVERVREILERSGLPPSALQLEVIEHVLLENPDAAAPHMQELAGLGVRFALDDFGTGYSNLDYLRRLPIHALKIDRSFIADLEHDPESRSITHAITSLGRALNLKVSRKAWRPRASGDWRSNSAATRSRVT